MAEILTVKSLCGVVVVVGGNGIKAKLSQTELVWALTELSNNVIREGCPCPNLF